MFPMSTNIMNTHQNRQAFLQVCKLIKALSPDSFGLIWIMMNDVVCFGFFRRQESNSLFIRSCCLSSPNAICSKHDVSHKRNAMSTSIMNIHQNRQAFLHVCKLIKALFLQSHKCISGTSWIELALFPPPRTSSRSMVCIKIPSVYALSCFRISALSKMRVASCCRTTTST